MACWRHLFSSYTFHSCTVFLMIPEGVRKIRKPKPWKHSQPITIAQLTQMRDEFWDTAPHYGGQKGRRSFLNVLVVEFYLCGS